MEKIIDLKKVLNDLEFKLINEAMEKYDGKKIKVAEVLSMKRSAFMMRLATQPHLATLRAKWQTPRPRKKARRRG